MENKRSYGSVKKKAAYLGFCDKKRVKLWTEAEIAILERYYPVEGYKVQKRLPGRSKDSIAWQAHHNLYIKSGIKKRRKIQCIETGIIYDNIAKANRAYGNFNTGSGVIGTCLRGQSKTAYKMHWRYVDGE